MNKSIKLLLFELSSLVVMVAGITIWWDSMLLSSILVYTITLLTIVFFHSKEDTIFFMYAALLGTFVEIVAIYYGVWKYENPAFLGIPYWTPPIWGYLFLIGRRLRDSFFKLTHTEIHYFLPPTLPRFSKIVSYDIGMYVFATVLTILFWEYNLVLILTFILLLIINVIKFHRPSDIFFIVSAGVIGSIIDIVCNAGGVWSYANPSFFKIPMWAPFGYAFLGLIFRRLSVVTVNYLFTALKK